MPLMFTDLDTREIATYENLRAFYKELDNLTQKNWSGKISTEKFEELSELRKLIDDFLGKFAIEGKSGITTKELDRVSTRMAFDKIVKYFVEDLKDNNKAEELQSLLATNHAKKFVEVFTANHTQFQSSIDLIFSYLEGEITTHYTSKKNAIPYTDLPTDLLKELTSLDIASFKAKTSAENGLPRPLADIIKIPGFDGNVFGPGLETRLQKSKMPAQLQQRFCEYIKDVSQNLGYTVLKKCLTIADETGLGFREDKPDTSLHKHSAESIKFTIECQLQKKIDLGEVTNHEEARKAIREIGDNWPECNPYLAQGDKLEIVLITNKLLEQYADPANTNTPSTLPTPQYN